MRTAFLVLALFACSKPDAPPPVAASDAEAFAISPPTPTPTPAPTPTPTLAPTIADSLTSPPAPLPHGPSNSLTSVDGGLACGAKGLPYCPLQAWMKANMNPAMSAQDFDALAAALEKVATFAPKEPGYPNWASIAKDGANTAHEADIGAVRAACRGCHEQYKTKYRAELRTRPIPPP